MKTAFDHIAIAAHRISEAPALLVGEFGGESGFGGPGGGEFSWWHWDYAGGGRIEVIEPAGTGGFVQRHLAARGPGVHHVTFKVPSLDAACTEAERLGYSIVGRNDSDAHWSEAFLHPKQALGITVQLTESKGGGDYEHWVPEARPMPEPSGPPVTVVGLRMRASDRDAVLRQWSGVLGAEVNDSGREISFTWGSPSMAITVDVEPGAVAGPVAIEVRADRALSLPEGPHPVLGAAFRQVDA